MSDTRRIINVDLNAEASSRGKINTSTVRWTTPDALTLYRGTQCLFRATCRMADTTTPLAFPSGSAFAFGINTDFDAVAGTGLVATLTAGFNQVSDWSSVDLSTGLVCWRADLSTAELKAQMSGKDTDVMYACLWYAAPGEAYTLVAQWELTVSNIAYDPTETTVAPGPGQVFDTIDRADASYIPRQADGASVRWYNGKLYFYNPDDGLWYAAGVRTVAGVQVFAPESTGVAL